MDTAILTNSLNQFLTTFNAAYGLIWANGGQALLWTLAGIELVLVALWWALGGNAQTLDVIKKTIILDVLAMASHQFCMDSPVFVYSLVDAGITGAGGAVGGHSIILDPSRIFSAGVNAINPIMTMIEDMDDWDQVVRLLYYGSHHSLFYLLSQSLLFKFF